VKIVEKQLTQFMEVVGFAMQVAKVVLMQKVVK
jgi:hypothetical protein